MILQIPGGVYFGGHPEAWRRRLTIPDAGRVYLHIPRDLPHTPLCEKGEPVRIGSPVAAFEDGSCLYASVSGTFDGFFMLRDELYAGITDNTQRMAIPVMEPENRPLQDLPKEDLLTAIRKLRIIDTRRGRRLSKTLEAGTGEARRILVDLTDAVAWSFTNYAFALQNTKDILGGAKVLCCLLNAAKIVLITDAARQKVKKAIREQAADESLFSVAEVGARYPVCDRTLMAAIYNQTSAAASKELFFVSGQTCAALFRGLMTGFAHTEQILTAAGPGFESPCVLTIPYGTTWKAVLRFCGYKGDPFETHVNSPINGSPSVGICRPEQECVFAIEKQNKKTGRCLSCGLCADACPAGLRPFRILTAKHYETVKEMTSRCLRCGCCSHVCPSDIPLETMIGKYIGKEDDGRA